MCPMINLVKTKFTNIFLPNKSLSSSVPYNRLRHHHVLSQQSSRCWCSPWFLLVPLSANNLRQLPSTRESISKMTLLSIHPVQFPYCNHAGSPQSSFLADLQNLCLTVYPSHCHQSNFAKTQFQSCPCHSEMVYDSLSTSKTSTESLHIRSWVNSPHPSLLRTPYNRHSESPECNLHSPMSPFLPPRTSIPCTRKQTLGAYRLKH